MANKIIHRSQPYVTCAVSLIKLIVSCTLRVRMPVKPLPPQPLSNFSSTKPQQPTPVTQCRKSAFEPVDRQTLFIEGKKTLDILPKIRTLNST